MRQAGAGNWRHPVLHMLVASAPSPRVPMADGRDRQMREAIRCRLRRMQGHSDKEIHMRWDSTGHRRILHFECGRQRASLRGSVSALPSLPLQSDTEVLGPQAEVTSEAAMEGCLPWCSLIRRTLLANTKRLPETRWTIDFLHSADG